MSELPTILVIDDEQDLRYSLERVLSSRGYHIEQAASGEEGLKQAQALHPPIILLDNRMGAGMSGIETLQHLRSASPESMVILMTAFGTTQTAIEAMKFGAFDYIIKPFDIGRILSLVEKALAAHRDLNANAGPTAPILNSEDYREGIVGSSEPMQEVFKVIGQVAASDVTVMITGESGTGKELVARCIMQHSLRSRGPFIAVNCAAIPESLIESELFGHEKGSFTGATAQRRGKFELCDGGTIFLDEIGDMSLPTQTKILRAIQEGEIQRVGGTETTKVDVRLLAATNKDLEKMVQAGTFREDLYYRLNVVRLRLPALRERRTDIPALVEFMLQKLAREHRLRARRFSADAMAILCAYDWPGNVRELENLVHRSAVVAQGETILRKDLPVDLLRAVAGRVPESGLAAAESAEGRAAATDSVFAAGSLAGSIPAAASAVAPAISPALPASTAPVVGVPAASAAAVSGAAEVVGVPGAAPVLADQLDLPVLYDALYARLSVTGAPNVLEQVSAELAARALSAYDGNHAKAAKQLGLSAQALRKTLESRSE